MEFIIEGEGAPRRSAGRREERPDRGPSVRRAGPTFRHRPSGSYGPAGPTMTRAHHGAGASLIRWNLPHRLLHSNPPPRGPPLSSASPPRGDGAHPLLPPFDPNNPSSSASPLSRSHSQVMSNSATCFLNCYHDSCRCCCR